jgi:hypothetical protein
MKTTLHITASLICALTRVVTLHAQAPQAQSTDRPRVVNAKLASRAISGALEKEFQGLLEHADAPQWIGYAVPEISGNRTMCCGNYSYGDSNCGRCALEAGDHGVNMSNSDKQLQPIALEGSQLASVLFRVEHAHVNKIRVFSGDCELDAGGRTLTWLTGVSPAQSVALLSGYVTGADHESGDSERSWNGALAAIAMHADPSADRAFENFVAVDQPESLRKHATFWLGSARGPAGLALLKRLAHADPSPEVRARVAFAFSVSQGADALDEMIRMAHEDSSERVRGQAIFWLAHKAGKKAVGAIDEAIANDPATGVKRKAVFALTRLPRDEGVPKLIEVARNNRNPLVRKQAMFWLGQSHDPRALAFFEEVLTH